MYFSDYGAYTAHPTVGVDTKSGNTNVVCKFTKSDMLYGPPTQTENYSGFGCWTDMGVTYDTSAQITKSGEAILHCQIKS